MSHGIPTDRQPDSNVTTCGNCQAPMPLGLRFCRNCGYRLGEGPAEYTETVRFPNGRPTATADNESSYTTTYGLAGGPLTSPASGPMKRQKKKMSGMTWMFLGLLVFFLGAAAFTAMVAPIRRGIAPTISVPETPRPYFGVNSFETAEGDLGVTFEEVEPPNGPADKAGLVGGDVITTFDGTSVHSEDDMTELLRQTPIGKTVEVVYVRDGETRTTKLTPITKEESDRLEKDFEDRPEGRGRFGYDDGDIERVPIPGTKMFGVRLDEIEANLPADMAGIKKGDVVIAIGDIPIRTTEELKSRLSRAIPYSTITVVVMRGSERLEIPVKMGRRR